MMWNPMPSKRATPQGVALGRGKRSLFLGFVRTGGVDAFNVDVIHEARGFSAAVVERDELAIGELFEIDGDAHAVPGFFFVAYALIIARLGGVPCR